jgi:hypothetical protein
MIACRGVVNRNPAARMLSKISSISIYPLLKTFFNKDQTSLAIAKQHVKVRPYLLIAGCSYSLAMVSDENFRGSLSPPGLVWISNHPIPSLLAQL